MAERDNRTTIRLPPKLQEKLIEEVEARGLKWEDRGDIIIEALSKFFMRESPEFQQQELRKIVEENAGLFSPIIASEVQRQVKLELAHLLGNQYRP